MSAKVYPAVVAMEGFAHGWVGDWEDSGKDPIRS